MTREIIVNGRFLSRRVTGVERYGREILARIGGSYRLEKTQANGAAGHVWEQCMLPAKVGQHSILWSPANTGPLAIENQALAIHDLSPLEHPEWFRKSFAAWYRLFLPMLARRVRVIFTPSESVKRNVCARFGVHNVVVTPNGVDHCVFYPVAEQHHHRLPASYILFVGTLEPRKNLNGLLQAWNEIKDEFRTTWLVIAGGTSKVFSHIKLPWDMERVHWLGYVPETDLPSLYAGASLFVLPSFNEGFGLPVLEAMARGTPVIVSDCDALKELVGDAGVIFGLKENQGLSHAIRECLRDGNLRSQLTERGLARASLFSWQTSANVVWNALNES